jgi:succinoglycan biosynthesis transport protein ExoP
MSDQSPAEPMRPPSLLGLVRRRWYALLIPLLLVPAAALGYSLTQEKEYEASTSLLFRDSGSGSPVLASEDPSREAATNVRLLQLGVLDDRVQARLGKPTDASVDVVAEADSNLATITVTASGPRKAARFANLYAQEYIALLRQTARRETDQELAAVRAELARLTPAELSGPRGNALTQREQDLTLAGVAPSGARQVGTAQPPSGPSSPRTARNVAIGIVIGLLLGIALAIALERRDRRIRDPREMAALFKRPIVGRIPRSRALKASPSTKPLPPPEAEAFRTLRANLGHLLADRTRHSIIVASANPKEGKTTVSWSLARAAAMSGAQVLLIEADMRRPVLAASLGANGAKGLSQLLSGASTLADVIHEVDFNGAAGPGSPSAIADVVLAGPVSPDSTEFLDSGRMEAVLKTVPERYDLIIIDTPPASVVSDALPILHMVDGVVVVGRLGVSTYESIGDLRERLMNLDARVLGVVVNADVPDRGAYGYYQAAPRD